LIVQTRYCEFPRDRDLSPAPTPYAGVAMKITTSALTLIAATTIGILSACGSQPAQAETPAQIWHDVVQCARAHGMPNLPDPTIDSKGQAHFPPGVPQPPQATRQACQSIYNRLPASVRNDSAPAPDIAMETRFAQCIRTHGVSDWPDPNADGSYPLTPDLGYAVKHVINSQGAGQSGTIYYRLKAAWDACRAYNSSGTISVSHP